MDYQAPNPLQHAPKSNFVHSNNAVINNAGSSQHVVLPPPSSPPPMFEPIPSTSVDQLQLRKLIDSRGERKRLNSLRSTLPHPSKATYFNKHDDKYKNEIAFVKNRQRHISINDLNKSIRKGEKGSLRRARKRWYDVTFLSTCSNMMYYNKKMHTTYYISYFKNLQKKNAILINNNNQINTHPVFYVLTSLLLLF